MFDNQHTCKFNSKQSSIRDLANEILASTCPRKNDSTRRQAEKINALFYNVFSDVIFSPCLLHAIVLGIENYLSTSMSCCSDGLAQLLPCLDLRNLGSENISVRE